MTDEQKPEKETITTVVKQPSAISSSISLMTSTQRKMLGVILREAQKQRSSVPDASVEYIYTFPIDYLRSVLGLEWMDSPDLRKHLKPLTNINIEYNYLGKDKKNVWGSGCILAGFEIEENSPYIKFAINPLLQKFILYPASGCYANINLLTLAKIKVERAVELYEWLVDYIKVNPPYLTLKDFRKIMGVADTEYSSFTDLRRYVIDPIRDEVNLKTDITCSYKPVRGYKNATIGIQWKAKAKKGCNPTKSNTFEYHQKEEELPVEEDPKPAPPSDDLDDLLVDDGPSKPNPIVDDFDDFDILDEPKPKAKEEPDELEAFTKETPLEPLPPIIRQILQAYEFNCIAHYGHPEQEIAKFDAHYRKHGKLPKSIADALRQVGLDVSDHLDCFEEQ